MSSESPYVNCPSCPEIKKKIDRIDLALLGPDGTGREGGLVKAVNDLEDRFKVQASWTDVFKPIVIAAVSSAVTFLLTYGILSHII